MGLFSSNNTQQELLDTRKKLDQYVDAYNQLYDDCHKLAGQIATDKTTINQLKLKIQQAKDRETSHFDSLVNADDLQFKLDKQLDIDKDLLEKLKKYQVRNHELFTNNGSLTNDYDDLVKKYNSLLKEYKQQKTDLESQSTKSSEYLVHIKQLKQQIISMQEKNREIESALDVANNHDDDQEEAMFKLRKDMNAVADENKQAYQLLDAATTKLKDYENVFAHQQAVNEDLGQQLDDLNAQNNDLKLQLLKYQTSTGEILEQRDNLRDKYNQANAWGFFASLGDHRHYIYQLRLADGCYYVGETTNLHDRFTSHFTGQTPEGFKSAYWTSLHHPENVIGLTEFDMSKPENTMKKIYHLESQLTIDTMKRYGYEKVRGGKFTAEDPDTVLHFLDDPGNQKEFGYDLASIGVPATNHGDLKTEFLVSQKLSLKRR